MDTVGGAAFCVFYFNNVFAPKKFLKNLTSTLGNGILILPSTLGDKNKKEVIKMNKEEILEMSKEENKKKDPYVLQVQSKGGNIASVAMLILAFIYLFYEVYTTGSFNSAIYSIVTIYNAVSNGYRAIKIEKDRKVFAIASFFWGVFTIFLILDYFKVI
ncbi:MAG: hypothetical protein IJR47_05035 [Clostridia bacterium]|nr:hypothetical protein [Clostridia bacterium]